MVTHPDRLIKVAPFVHTRPYVTQTTGAAATLAMSRRPFSAVGSEEEKRHARAVQGLTRAFERHPLMLNGPARRNFVDSSFRDASSFTGANQVGGILADYVANDAIELKTICRGREFPLTIEATHDESPAGNPVVVVRGMFRDNPGVPVARGRWAVDELFNYADDGIDDMYGQGDEDEEDKEEAEYGFPVLRNIRRVTNRSGVLLHEMHFCKNKLTFVGPENAVDFAIQAIPAPGEVERLCATHRRDPASLAGVIRENVLPHLPAFEGHLHTRAPTVSVRIGDASVLLCDTHAILNWSDYSSLRPQGMSERLLPPGAGSATRSILRGSRTGPGLLVLRVEWQGVLHLTFVIDPARSTLTCVPTDDFARLCHAAARPSHEGDLLESVLSTTTRLSEASLDDWLVLHYYGEHPQAPPSDAPEWRRTDDRSPWVPGHNTVLVQPMAGPDWNNTGFEQPGPPPLVIPVPGV